ncbi:MAG: hypothetical protein WA974_17345 [Thermodesulfobacteriota bacterium]
MILFGPRAERRNLKALSLAVVLAAVLFLAGFVRPVRIAGDHGSILLCLWAWQQGRIEFINSVTNRPVVIRFKMPWRFSGFSVQTDPGTEEYYTAGKYSWNERLSMEQTRVITTCSEVGITLTLGGRVFQEKGGCLHAALLWPS